MNSNRFFGGVISGTVHDVAILIEGPGANNNNCFFGIIVEPSKTSMGHIVVTHRSWVEFYGLRLEARKQAEYFPNVPAIKFETCENVLSGGMIGHSWIDADFSCNPRVEASTAKFIDMKASTDNRFPNPAFSNADDGAMSLEGWALSGAQAMTTVQQAGVSERVPGFRVLTITVAGGATATLSPSSWQVDPPGGLRAASEAGCAFGAYINVSYSGAMRARATMKAPSGSLITSATHLGDDHWRFISMASGYDPDNGPLPKFYLTNDLAFPADFHVTAPSFAFGRAAPSVGSVIGSGVGGYLSLVANGGIAARSIPVLQSSLDAAANSELTLDRDANTFILDLTMGSAIRRLNQKTATRFLPGTVITLLFEQSGVIVFNSGYIQLASATGSSWSSTVGASMALLARSTGTWQEVWSQN